MNILYLIPYTQFVPPENGGLLRCFYLLKGVLDSGHNVHLVVRQPENEIRKYLKHANLHIHYCSDDFPGHGLKGLFGKIYKTIYYRILRRSIKGPAGIFLIQSGHKIKSILRKENIEMAFHEHLESMMASKLIRSVSPSTFQILDAHNVDHILLKQQNNADYKKYYESTKWYESNLYKFVDMVITCSAHDLEIFNEINNHKINTLVVPNGTDTSLKQYDVRQEKFNNKNIIFCGDLRYPPNLEGLKWFYNTVWKKLHNKYPDLNFCIVGKYNPTDYIEITPDNSVKFTGRVENLEEYYFNAGISIVPLKMGSGTRLKILEAMSFGNPVVSTTIGADGINYSNGENIEIADSPNDMIEKIETLLQNELHFNTIRTNARKLVEDEYDWGKIGHNMIQEIKRYK